MKIAFLVTSQGISGGHNILFEHAYHLAKRGHEVNILGKSIAQFNYVYEWHDRAPDLNFDAIENCLDSRHYDIAIATNFNSAFSLPLVSADQYCLFMQANESDFVSENDAALKGWLSSVFDFNLPTIVSAEWMRGYLYERNGREAMVCRSGIRKDLFASSGPRHEPLLARGLRILVEGPLDAPHKNVATTLKLCRASNAGEVWLLTGSRNVEGVPAGVRVFSSVAIKDLASIYRSCDLLVKLSTSEGMFGPPLEMLHCGGTVISYDVPGHEEYLISEVNSLIVPMGDEGSVVRAINRLCDSPELSGRLKKHARDTAEEWPDWDVASARFEKCLVWASENPGINRDNLSQTIKDCTKIYLNQLWRSKKKQIPAADYR